LQIGTGRETELCRLERVQPLLQIKELPLRMQALPLLQIKELPLRMQALQWRAVNLQHARPELRC
jgi:hypothetical protein